MGVFTFKWPHAASEVYVTGTFDKWSKSEKMVKVGDHFEKTVTLPDDSEKIYYKFVVDGNWTTDHTGPQEKDHEGNDNNVLLPEQIIKDATPAQVIMSSAAPESTTAELAKDVPLEKREETKPEGLPGTFPETPANDLDKPIGINPLPAADGAVNPIKLAPGEPIPPSLAGNNINSHVKLDQESYEKSDTLAGVDTTLPPVSGGNLIPESSLPIASGADVTINSAAPNSTTAALAAEVPLEPKVPEVVKESQNKAGVDPEASGISSEVVEKEKVEEELLKKVPEAPSTAEGTSGKGTEKSEGDKTLLETAAATATGLGAAAVAAAVAAKDTVLDQAGVASTTATDAAAKLPESVKAQLPASVQETAKEQKLEEVSPEVPTEVKESIAEAGKSPEAAGNTAAVEEKKEVEAELLKEVKPVEAVGEASAKKEEPKAETNGTEAAAAPKEPETPSKAAEPSTPASSSSKPAASPATTEKKKKNRISGFFGKLKSKIGDKK